MWLYNMQGRETNNGRITIPCLAHNEPCADAEPRHINSQGINFGSKDFHYVGIKTGTLNF